MANELIADIRCLIEELVRQSPQPLRCSGQPFWRIDRRINQEIVKDGRAEYGKRILATLSQQLQSEYGRGFSVKICTT